MRIRWSEHEARGVLAAWRKSDLTLQRFARERGLVPKRLRSWRRTPEAAEKAKPNSLAFVRVQRSYAIRGEPVAVYLRSGHVIRVGRGFDEDAFSRVVALLEAP